jgi:hypothetical protein
MFTVNYMVHLLVEIIIIIVVEKPVRQAQVDHQLVIIKSRVLLKVAQLLEVPINNIPLKLLMELRVDRMVQVKVH